MSDVENLKKPVLPIQTEIEEEMYGGYDLPERVCNV